MSGPRGEEWVGRIEELSAVATEARQVLGELRSELREARRFLREFREATATEVDKAMEDRVGAAVKKGLDEYAETLRKAINSGVKHVEAEFDKLFKAYMVGKDRVDLRDVLGRRGPDQ